jgi:hypothetical protein
MPIKKHYRRKKARAKRRRYSHMFIYVYICISIYGYINIHINVCIFVFIYTHIYVYALIYRLSLMTGDSGQPLLVSLVLPVLFSIFINKQEALEEGILKGLERVPS